MKVIPSIVISAEEPESKALGPPDGAAMAVVPFAVIVSIELTDIAPGVTEEGDKAQAGNGAGPTREQAS